jgi:hypothetical protein
LAAVTLLYGLGIVQLGRFGWSIISLTLVAGALLLCYVPELLFGTYRRSLR